MFYYISVVIENGVFVAICLICLYGAYTSFKQHKTVPGADLMAIGFLMYAVYGLLAFTGPGFTGSYFRDFAKVGKLNSITYVYFLSFALRMGLVLVLIGMFRVSRSLRAQTGMSS